MMSSLENEYNGIIAGAKEQSRTEREQFERVTGIQAGTNFQFGYTHVEQRPYIKATCSGCKHTLFIEQPDYKWRHCGVISPVPVELGEKLKAAQIKKGLRKAESF